MVELDSKWFITIAALLGGYLFVFGFLRRVNEWYYVGRLGRKTKDTLPPGDMGWPFLGHIPSFYKAFKYDPDSFINDLISRYGKKGMYRTHLFGCPSIIVCSPEACYKVLSDDEQLKVGYPASTMSLAGKRSLYNISNAEHKRLRRLTTYPITGHEALSVYIDLIEGASVRVLEHLSSMNKPCEFLTELRKLAFEVITTIFLGPDADHHDEFASVERFYVDVSYGFHSLAINLPGFAFHKAVKARVKLMKVLQTMLDEKRKNTNGTKTKKYMMELLMDVKDEEGRKLEDEEIKELLIIFLLAGHETSSHGILWTIIYLMENPHIFQKAKNEQEEILERRASTQKGLNINEIKQMKYLSNVIDEMLRRTTISFATFRQAKADLNINGYAIPKGWKVLVWNRAVHMDPDTYINPKEFDPSRWEKHTPKVGSSLWFGLGSRFCPGSNLAKFEISIFLHHFLLNYTMERINPECPVTFLPGPNLSDNCVARIIKVK